MHYYIWNKWWRQRENKNILRNIWNNDKSKCPTWKKDYKLSSDFNIKRKINYSNKMIIKLFIRYGMINLSYKLNDCFNIKSIKCFSIL